MAAKKGFNFLYPLVICIVLIIGLTAFAISMNSDIEDARRLHKAEVKKRRDKESDNKDLQNEVWALREFITGKDDQAVAMEVMKSTLFEDFSDLKEILLAEQGDPAQGRKEYTYLEEFYGDVKEDLRSQSQAIAALRTDKKTAQTDLAVERQAKQKLRDDKDLTIKGLDTKLTEEQNARQEENRKNTGEIQRLIDEKADIANSQELMRRDLHLQIAERDTEISRLSDRIKSLVKKQELTLATAEPDGEIVFADNEMETAYIDLGRQHGLSRGLPFNVFQIEKGGRRKHKGRIEVLDLQEDMAKVAIIETVNPADPIVKGDRIISPLFSKSETQIYVLLGEMVNPRYSKAELIRKIQDAGGQVDAKVSVKTDFVVAGKDAELLPEFETALQLGIRVLRENDLLMFVAP